MDFFVYFCRMKNYKHYILALLMISLCPSYSMGQKSNITLGSCEVSEGNLRGQYKGQMLGGKPHGKGSVVYSNGDIYDGEFEKGKRQGYGVYSFSDGEK